MESTRIFFSVLAIGILSACASHPVANTNGETSKAKVDPNAIDLELRGKIGEESRTVYHSESSVEDFEDSQKVRDHQETMDFTVLTKVAEANEKQLKISTKTIEKDGTSGLHDFAFPELDETVDFIYTKKAQVLSADPFPKESIFFLPPISLPNGPAKVGDTWTMNHAWVSSNQGLPLNLDLVTIFKDLVSCGKFGQCADLEVSGRIDVISDKFQRSVSFDSRLWGRILFSIDKGDVVWSEVRSRESFKAGNTEMRVMSCMVSRMVAPDEKPEKQNCKPTLKAVQAPRL